MIQKRYIQITSVAILLEFSFSFFIANLAYATGETEIVGGVIGILGAVAGSASKANQAKKAKQQQEVARKAQEEAAVKQRQQQALMDQAVKFIQEYQSANEQVWQTEVSKVNLANGEKVYEKDYDQVFDSVITALSNLGMKIDSTEKQSGVINATGNPLAVDLRKKLNYQKASDYAKLEGYDSMVLSVPIVVSRLSSKDAYNPLGLTVRVLNQGLADNKNVYDPTGAVTLITNPKTNKTKIKLRIVRESYPPYAEEVYKAVWNEIDKQLFLDVNIDR